MNKKLLAIVVGAAAAMPMAAMANVTVYGRAHVSVDFLDNGAQYSETNISSNSSRLGFKADKEVGDLTAFVQIEQEINISNSGTTDTLTTRDTFVGLRGGFGSVSVGRFDSPFNVARGPANLFGDQVGDMRNLTRVGNARFDERTENTVQYSTPSFNGLVGAIAYSHHEGAVNLDTEERDKDSTISTSVTYVAGPFDGALAYERADENTVRGERDAWRLAAGYKITPAVRLVGFYQKANYDGGTPAQQDLLSSDVYGLGADFMVAPNTFIRGMWLNREADADDTESNMYVVGIEHRLDRALRLYANYAMVNNDDAVALTPWSQARTATPAGALGERSRGLSAGLRYDF